MKICVHCFVSGQVQGVFFRAKTQQKAQLLGVTGWVRNLDDGRVEVFACGEKDTIEQLHEWLWEGSALASVTDVTCQEMPWQEHYHFEITD